MTIIRLCNSVHCTWFFISLQRTSQLANMTIMIQGTCNSVHCTWFFISYSVLHNWQTWLSSDKVRVILYTVLDSLSLYSALHSWQTWLSWYKVPVILYTVLDSLSLYSALLNWQTWLSSDKVRVILYIRPLYLISLSLYNLFSWNFVHLTILNRKYIHCRYQENQLQCTELHIPCLMIVLFTSCEVRCREIKKSSTVY